MAIALYVLAAVLSISPAALGQDLQATLNNISKVPIDIRQKFGVFAYQTIAEKVKSGQFPTSWLKDTSHGGDFYLAVEASCGEDMVAFAKSAKDLGNAQGHFKHDRSGSGNSCSFSSDAQKSR